MYPVHGKLSSQEIEVVPMTELRNVCFSYGKHKIIDSLSFTVQPGECVVLAGPNGSGKSTVLSLLAGVFRPGSGEVHTEGPVGFIPQGTALFEDMSVGDNLRFFGKFSGKSDAPLPFGVEQMWKTRVSRLSGGMKKRVSIAAALQGNPSLLLFDEPCAALDVEYREELISLIHTLKKQGRRIVYVSHDPLEIASFYDKLIFFGDTPVTYTRDQLSGSPADDSFFCSNFAKLFREKNQVRGDLT